MQFKELFFYIYIYSDDLGPYYSIELYCSTIYKKKEENFCHCSTDVQLSSIGPFNYRKIEVVKCSLFISLNQFADFLL